MGLGNWLGEPKQTKPNRTEPNWAELRCAFKIAYTKHENSHSPAARVKTTKCTQTTCLNFVAKLAPFEARVEEKEKGMWSWPNHRNGNWKCYVRLVGGASDIVVHTKR